AVSQSSSRLFLVSAPSLDTAALDRFQQQLTRTRIQSTMAGEVVFELKIQEGRVSEATFVENASSLKDAASIEAIKQALQEVKLPQATNSLTRMTVRVE
ncbi:MAG: after-VIT domain-containing protein, partial [Anaerolineae bacterium]|nr:after-VIT domain-containing protein [Gloeobacterales cyanobacterium ES-bin-313]